MKKVQLIITDAGQADLGQRSQDPPATDARVCDGDAVSPDQTPANGTLRIEAVVSDAQSEALVQTVIRDINDGALAIHAADLILAELQKAGPDARNVYYEIIALVERELIKKVLDECDGIQTKAASRLGINRNTLHKKLQQLGLAESSDICEERSVPA